MRDEKSEGVCTTNPATTTTKAQPYLPPPKPKKILCTRKRDRGEPGNPRQAVTTPAVPDSASALPDSTSVLPDSTSAGLNGTLNGAQTERDSSTAPLTQRIPSQ